MSGIQVNAQHEYIIVNSLDTVGAGYIAVGAKTDGLYLRKHGAAEERILTTEDIGETVEAYAGVPSANGYVLSSTTAGVRSWIPVSGGGVTPVDDILYWDSANSKYKPYAAKKDEDPGFPYLYSILDSMQDQPTLGAILGLDGNLMATNFACAWFNGSVYQISGMSAQEILMIKAALVNNVASVTQYGQSTDDGIFGYYFADILQLLEDRFRLIHDGVNRGATLKSWQLNYVDQTEEPLPFNIDSSEIIIKNGTALKWLALDADKKVVYLDVPTGGTTPTDELLHWDSSNSRYSPYSAKKALDPGFPYFFVNTDGTEFPSYYNNLILDGNLLLSQVICTDDSAIYSSALFGTGIQFYSTDTYYLGEYFRIANEIGECLINAYHRVSNISEKSDSIKIGDITNVGGRFNEHIIVDPDNQRFDINMTNVRLNKGTASKYYGTDANKNLVALADPDAFWQRVSDGQGGYDLSSRVSTDFLILYNTLFAINHIEPTGITRLNGNWIDIESKVTYPLLNYIRKGSTVGNDNIKANDILGSTCYYGSYNSALYISAVVESIAGSSDFSGTNKGSCFRIRTVALENGITLRNRFLISESGNVVINEDGDAADFRVEGDNDQNLLVVKGNVDRVGIGTGGSIDAKLHIKTITTEGTEAIKIEQLDVDQAFIQYTGTSAHNFLNNISTINGAGSVVGPRGQSATEDYWQFTDMVKMKVNGVDRWYAGFTPVSGT